MTRTRVCRAGGQFFGGRRLGPEMGVSGHPNESTMGIPKTLVAEGARTGYPTFRAAETTYLCASNGRSCLTAAWISI